MAVAYRMVQRHYSVKHYRVMRRFLKKNYVVQRKFSNRRTVKFRQFKDSAQGGEGFYASQTCSKYKLFLTVYFNHFALGNGSMTTPKCVQFDC